MNLRDGILPHLHRQFGWFKCRFLPPNWYENGEKVECQWCGQEHAIKGHIGFDSRLTKVTTNKK